MWTYVSNDVLIHHGIKGQRWGVRRFQNRDGSLTSKGRARYDTDPRDRQTHQERSRKTRITKKRVAIGAAVVGGTVLAAYGATRYKKLVKARTVTNAASAYSKVASGVSKVTVNRTAVPRTTVVRTAVPKTTVHTTKASSVVSSVAKKAASSAKSSSKPVLSLNGHHSGFTQADMDRMIANLGKMSDLARDGQEVLRNL